jgi:hypothetical protein
VGADGAQGIQGIQGEQGIQGIPGPGVEIADEAVNYDGYAIEYFTQYDLGALTVPDKGTGWAEAGSIVGGGSGTIISYTPEGGAITAKCLSLANATYTRKFSWGANWQRVRIVILARVDIAIPIPFTTEWRFGLCHVDGTVNLLSTNFVGVRGRQDIATFGDYAADMPNAYRGQPPAFQKIESAIITMSGNATGTGWWYITNLVGQYSPVVFELNRYGCPGTTKSAGGAAIGCGDIMACFRSGEYEADGVANCTGTFGRDTITKAVPRRRVLDTLMGVSAYTQSTWGPPVVRTGTPSPNGVAGWGSDDLNYSDAAGALDGFQFTWPGAVPLEIYGIIIQKAL